MIVIVIVNWNVRDLVRECLGSIERFPATAHRQHVIVVDNASSDDSAGMIRRTFPGVELIESRTNLGFAGGNNLGLDRANRLFASDVARRETKTTGRANDRPSNYVLLLNPDAEVTPGALDTLLAYADAHPDAGVVGPQLRYADGSIQSSRRRFPTLVTALFESTWLQPYAPKRVLERYYALDRRDDEICDVDWLVGAALLVRKAAYDQAGLLDDQTFFMYSEEVDWCRRIKACTAPGLAGRAWRVIYNPQAVVIHHAGRSSQQVSARRMILFNTSKVRYFAKHHGAGQAALLRAALLCLFAEQMAVESAKWLMRSRRDLRAGRLRAYRAVLKSGLR